MEEQKSSKSANKALKKVEMFSHSIKFYNWVAFKNNYFPIKSNRHLVLLIKF